MPDQSTHTQALISVIIPVYNQQRHISRCLASIVSQTYKNLEIIVVNDGSTDGSARIINRFASNDHRVNVLYQDNAGVAIARKNGFSKSTGEWCVFVDSDDYLLPNSIETLHSAARKNDVDLACGRIIRRFGPFIKRSQSPKESDSVKVIRQPELFSSYYISFFGVNILPVTMYGKIIRKETIDQAMNKIDIFATPLLHMGEDEAFNLQLFPYLSSYLCLSAPVYVYRYGGVTSGYNRYISELLDFGDFRIGLLDHYGYDKGYSPLFVEYVNILITFIQQELTYGKMNVQEAKEWLSNELEGRYLVQRMRDFYSISADVPGKCRMVIQIELDSIVDLACKRIWHRPLLSMAKRILR